MILFFVFVLKIPEKNFTTFPARFLSVFQLTATNWKRRNTMQLEKHSDEYELNDFKNTVDFFRILRRVRGILSMLFYVVLNGRPLNKIVEIIKA